MICNDCPRTCGVDRNLEKGFCNEGQDIRVAKVIPNFMWEEPPISMKNGTFAIFFSGCSLRCSFCQNYEISRGGKGYVLSDDEFISLLKQADESDSESIDLITPTHFTSRILTCLKQYKPKKKLVWNSSGYENVEQIEKLVKYVDIFLPDFKYFDKEISFGKSKAKGYFEVASKSISKMCELKKNKYNKGVLVQGVIIRHLVLPGCVQDSFKILDFIVNNIKKPIISLMSQYTPSGENKEGRKLFLLEYKSVLAHAEKLGLKEGFFQEMNSANEGFIPEF